MNQGERAGRRQAGGRTWRAALFSFDDAWLHARRTSAAPASSNPHAVFCGPPALAMYSAAAQIPSCSLTQHPYSSLGAEGAVPKV